MNSIIPSPVSQLNVSFQNNITNVTKREEFIRTVFGLPVVDENIHLIKNLPLYEADITYITGFSGSGKTSLLKEIRKLFPEAMGSEDCALPEGKVIDSFECEDEGKVIRWLSRFGLGEARIMVTPCQNLSAGQKTRLNLALLLWSRPKVVIIDEFLANLDRLTARVIAFQFQKIVRQEKMKVIVATAHDDLHDALFEGLSIVVDFMGEFSVMQNHEQIKQLPELDDVIIENGTIEDYKALKRFHYMDAHLGDQFIEGSMISLKRAMYKGRVVGIRMFSSPFPKAFERYAIFRRVNESILVSSRVIIHPSFRGLGISTLLGRDECLPKGYKVVCTHSALELYFSFDKKCGFETRIHPSVNKTALQEKLEAKLSHLGCQRMSELHDLVRAYAFWEGISSTDKQQLTEVIREILIEYDVQILNYYCDLLGIDKTELEPSFQSFYSRMHSKIGEESAYKYFTEVLYFPMQGLYKYIG